MELYYNICPLPAVPENSEKEIYEVVPGNGDVVLETAGIDCAIAVFDDYSLAVGLIELIEEYCKSKGLKNAFFGR